MRSTKVDSTNSDKTRVYQLLAALNLHMGEVLEDVERLSRLRLLRSRFQRESLKTCQVTIEETRAWINLEATGALHEREQSDRARWGRKRHRFETKYQDPEDVLIRAEGMRTGRTRSVSK